MSVEQAPPVFDERQQMLLDARAASIGHCESRLVDIRAVGRGVLAWALCNVLGFVIAVVYLMKNPRPFGAVEAYQLFGIMNFLSIPIGFAVAKGVYHSIPQRYKDDREAAGLREI